ncbi:unnamed protein product [Rhodiola kirilowii]
MSATFDSQDIYVPEVAKQFKIAETCEHDKELEEATAELQAEDLTEWRLHLSWAPGTSKNWLK